MNHYYDTPIGCLELSASNKALHSIHFNENKASKKHTATNTILNQVITELSEYFNGNRETFSVPLKPEGTDFQKSVWSVLREIPYGQTISYGQIADKLGNPNKVRAVGKATGSNPIPIIVPCHRVIGSDGSLVGYAGGIHKKQFLLKHEGAILF